MSLDIFFIAVGLLLLFAVFDLVVGVSNDAVNFLNSSIGSRVAPRHIIMIIASLGIIAGVLFSSGMMEVARKGIFHPQFFTMPELIIIFMAVMLTDVLLLDLFNTYGLPTSTTVSIVFELLGATVAVSILKVIGADESILSIGEYINTGKAMIIIFGILLSVIVAFIFGAIAQFLTRCIFTFNYEQTFRRYGALWGGFAMAVITLFLLVKGAKGASFMTKDTVLWIRANQLQIFAAVFAMSAVVFQALIVLFRVNILKPIVLVGTFSLAMAFAANDLVNFIGVPLAGLHAYKTAMVDANPLGVNMAALQGKIQFETFYLLIAGVVMVSTLWISRKARTVSDTEISLARQDEGIERFESFGLARVIVRMVTHFLDNLKAIVPSPVLGIVRTRMNIHNYESKTVRGGAQSFDLLRASVNLMVASSVVSFATSMKLPLSTTYVTFMVAMGTSFADRAWGRENAVYRVTGVLTVIGGWFMTAFMAFSVAFIYANILHFSLVLGVCILLAFTVYTIYRTHKAHESHRAEIEEEKVFNLKKIKDARGSMASTFEHMAFFLAHMRENLALSMEALFKEDLGALKKQKKGAKKIQHWSNIITANIFKVMRLVHADNFVMPHNFGNTTRCLQSITESFRDTVIRSYVHIDDNHKGLLDIQVQEIREAEQALNEMLLEMEATLDRKQDINALSIRDKAHKVEELVEQYTRNQSERIHNRSSKTRLSILFYAILENMRRISSHSLKLFDIFEQSFRVNNQ